MGDGEDRQTAVPVTTEPVDSSERRGLDIMEHAMTYDEFLERLRRLQRKWRLLPINGCRWIMSERGGHSPLTAIANVATRKSYRRKIGHHRSPMYQERRAAQDLKMSDELRVLIESAITEDRRLCELWVRRDLLAACRLRQPRQRTRSVKKRRDAPGKNLNEGATKGKLPRRTKRRGPRKGGRT